MKEVINGQTPGIILLSNWFLVIYLKYDPVSGTKQICCCLQFYGIAAVISRIRRSLELWLQNLKIPVAPIKGQMYSIIHINCYPGSFETGIS